MKKVKKKAILISALVLCISVMLNVTVFAQENFEIDNHSQREYNHTEEGAKFSLNSVDAGSALDGVGDSSEIVTPFIIALVRENPSFFSSITDILFIGTKVTILKFSGDYCLIENESGVKGYVHKIWLRGGKDSVLKLNRYYDHVYVGKTSSKVIARYNGSGTVTWSTNYPDIISVDSSSGAVTAKKPGTANLIAKVGTQEAECTVYSIFQWKSGWSGKALKRTEIKTGPSDDTGTLYTLPTGAIFTVGGDDGGTSGWAYGKYKLSEDKEYWGFVKIEDISTKGTVSQYNSMGWSYPIQNTKFIYISSPYGPRSSSSSGRHLGMDLSRGTYASIEGENLVAAFDGKVFWINDSYNSSTKEPSYGYCVIIESEDADPVSGKKLRAVYMHLLEVPSVNANEAVEAGKTVLGRVGSTGRSSGSHLHFEVNNCGEKFAGPSNSDSFDKTINPTFFYMNKSFTGNDGTPGTKYWYNYNN